MRLSNGGTSTSLTSTNALPGSDRLSPNTTKRCGAPAAAGLACEASSARRPTRTIPCRILLDMTPPPYRIRAKAVYAGAMPLTRAGDAGSQGFCFRRLEREVRFSPELEEKRETHGNLARSTDRIACSRRGGGAAIPGQADKDRRRFCPRRRVRFHCPGDRAKADRALRHPGDRGEPSRRRQHAGLRGRSQVSSGRLHAAADPGELHRQSERVQAF